MPANQCPVNWESYHGKKHLLLENLFDAKLTQSSWSLVVALMINYESKNIRFYLNLAAKVYMCYDRLLFCIYNKKNLSLVYTADYTELKVLKKSIITLDVLIDSKPEVVNFCNVFYALELEYNLLSISIIEKADYLILAKKGKMTVSDNKDNITLEATRIRTSYLVNIPTSKRTLALASLYSVPYNNVS